jgi:hypothetical protein
MQVPFELSLAASAAHGAIRNPAALARVASARQQSGRLRLGGLDALRKWFVRLPSLPPLPSFNLGGGRAVTAVMVGEQCSVVRVEARSDGLHLVAAESGPAAELARWKPLFRGCQGLLVLRSEERFLLALDKPEVPDAELNLAVRWPMGEALGVEPEQLLTTAVALPRVNEAVRAQVLGIASRLDAVKAQLLALRTVGIDVRSIDVVDSALRGMALMQPEVPASAVAVSLVGNTMSIGLIQQGRICALRSVPLPERDGYADADLAEQLALNARRTFDHYERQAMLSHRSAEGAGPGAALAPVVGIGRALASVSSLSQAGLETFCSALPDAPQLFDLAAMLHGSPELHARCNGHDEITALACVAATRLFDTGSVAARPLPAERAEAAA